MDRDNGVVRLKEWISSHNVNKESEVNNYLRLFYNMDKEMKNLHKMGYYINNFEDISIYIDENSYPQFSVSELYEGAKDELIHENIYYLSALALGVYNDCYQYINPRNKEFLRESFSDFASFIPDDVKPYYRGIFERNATVYLSDFMDLKKEKDMKKFQDEFDSSSNERGKGQNLKKSTAAGKLFAEDNNVAAFALIYIFPAIIFLMAILIPLMIVVNS